MSSWSVLDGTLDGTLDRTLERPVVPRRRKVAALAATIGRRTRQGVDVDISTDPVISSMLSEHAIRKVLLRYCRGIDRRRFDIVRDCYHPDATDEHGDFVGSVDEFIAHAERSLATFESTVHFVGNILVDVRDDDPDRARSETYTLAMHRVPPRGDRPRRDHVVALRYIDDFARRDGVWRIANRVCAFDWTRTDPVTPGWDFTEAFRMSRSDGADVVFADDLAAEIRVSLPPAT